MLKHQEEIKTFLAKCYKDTRVAASELFSDIFYTPYSSLHHQIFDVLDSGAKKVAIAAPRGLGKTSIARAVAAKGILFRDVQFILYVSCSSTVAEMQTENLKVDLRTNSLVRELFGDIKFSEAEGLDDSFSKLAWVAFGSTLILPRGAGQQVRGMNWRNFRPQLIIVDDLENKDEVRNEENRRKLKEWFYSDLLRCVNKYKDDWRIIYIDTIKHEDSLLQNLVSSKDWESVVLEICNDDLKSNAPDYMSDDEIKAEYAAYEEAGMLDTFFMELRNIPIAASTAAFRREYFKYFDEFKEKLDENSDIENIVIIDPAKTVNPSSADSAIIGIGFNRRTTEIYIRDLMAGKMHPDEMVDQALAMCVRLKARVLAVEETSLKEFISYPIKNAIAIRNMVVEYVPLEARGSKIEKRIPALIPFYRRGQIYHNKAVCTQLESQLLSFPKCRRFDCIDAEAYIVELLEKGMKYGYDEDDEEPIDEWLPPGKDEPEFEGWRVI